MAGIARLKSLAVPIGIAAVASVVLFWDALINLWVRWGEQQELSHSYFIPAISLWLVWVNRDRLQKSIGDPSWAGAGLMAFAALLVVTGRLTESFIFQQLAIVVAIAGATAAYGGLSLLRAAAAPIAFLLFAVPPPYWFLTVLSWNFQEVSSQIGVAMIKMMGVPVFLTGNIIDLGELKLQVAEACSGLRYLFPFLSLGVMTAYLYRGPLWHKLVIVTSTVPITILMNSFRIAVTGALVQAYGIQHAEGALHFFEGWVVFLLCMVALFLVVTLLGRFTRPPQSALDALGSPELPIVPPSKSGAAPIMAMGVFAALLVASIGLSRISTVDNLIRPERADFDQLPAEFVGWEAEIVPMDLAVAEVLAADDAIVANLRSEDGEFMNLYLAYLAARRDGRSWHSPRQCIPGGGWEIESHDVREAVMSDGTVVNYNRLVIENRGYRQLVYYWFDQRGRKIADEFVMRIALIYDAIRRKRSDGAMVRMMTPVGKDEGLEDADALLLREMEELQSFLPKYVPE